MASTENQLNQILLDIEQQASHSFVDRHIKRPEVPAFFVVVLFCVLRSHQLPADRIHLYCVTITLMQMGLDIHECVSPGLSPATNDALHRPLTVLAGDYFSSLFYRMLSEAGEIDGLRCLSQAICSVNESKMELYSLRDVDPVPWQTVMELVRQVRGGLISAVSSFFCRDFQQVDPWELLSGHLMALDYWSRPAVSARWTIPEPILQSTAADAWRLAKDVRPLEVRHELLKQMQQWFASHVHEALVREG
jgi:heptaprenyl diphosphate synthase